MSRDLPAHPNLDHLKKQAKELLRELQRQIPDTKLADAQHALAREYGFRSWPKLRAHVESLRRATVGEENPFVGYWTANISKSKGHPDRRIHSATLQFGVVGDTVTITDVVVDDSGRVESRNTLQADAKEHPSEENPRYVLVARWLGSQVLEAVARRDGQVVGLVTYEVSADGKTLTLSARDLSETHVEQSSVFDRTIP